MNLSLYKHERETIKKSQVILKQMTETKVRAEELVAELRTLPTSATTPKEQGDERRNIRTDD